MNDGCDQLKILDEIQEERNRQELKWGADREQHFLYWLAILVEEVGEVSKDLLDSDGSARDELIQVAAVAVAFIEAIDRKAV